MRLHGARIALGLAAVALALTAVWLAFDNPDVERTGRAGSYTCLAPWDTVLNKASNFPGGEPRPDGAQIAAHCRDAGRARFDWAVAAGSAAAALAVITPALARRRSRRGPGTLVRPG